MTVLIIQHDLLELILLLAALHKNYREKTLFPEI